MPYPPQEANVKEAVLSILRDHTSRESGLGYNLLFDRTKNRLGKLSLTTFNRYLQELVHDGAVKKEDDPRHRRGVVIYRNAGAAKSFELLFELQARLRQILEEKKVVPGVTEYDTTPEANRNLWVLLNCGEVAHKVLFKLIGLRQDLFVRFTRTNGRIRLEVRKPEEKSLQTS